MVAVGLVGVLPAAAAPAQPSPIANAACTRATIGGQSKCIARGQFCAVRYERDYRRYGLSCSKYDRNGAAHLQ
jgi:hypothetical protein